MKWGQSILSGMYLLMMVLIPYLHLCYDGRGEPSVQALSCCGEHGHGSEKSPVERQRHSEDHESCSLCQLLVLAADAPEIGISLDAAFCLGMVFIAPESDLPSICDTLNRTRAPPFKIG